MALKQSAVEFKLSGSQVRVAYLRRTGRKAPVLCLHGFGSSKEDYADLALHPALVDRDLILLDAPGCGQSECNSLERVTIPFLRDVAERVADELEVGRFHLIGHSMGGLTALLLAEKDPDRIMSFTNIEGNVSPEDCFLSRQIVDHPADGPQDFMDAFIERIKNRPEWSCRLYATALPVKVRPEVVGPIFRSMVKLSGEEPLLETFTGFRFPRLFVYGEQNKNLSYLGGLPVHGVELAEIPFSGHFPMYSNPQALWSRLASFVNKCDLDE